MKKFLLTLIILSSFTVSFAVSGPVEKPRIYANKVFIPLGISGDKISVLDLSRITVKETEAYTGKKMKFADRLVFKIAQKKLRESINPDGTLNDKKIAKFKAKRGGESGFHFGGFALGFLLGIIGVLIAYLINDDYKSNRTKWAWIGFLVQAALALLALLA
ncbi:MAG: hypothetical protein SGI96_09080 [Bacteroidota bacterium]|nr:hypothetical protein [Bacteroidota bacterium]